MLAGSRLPGRCGCLRSPPKKRAGRMMTEQDRTVFACKSESPSKDMSSKSEEGLLKKFAKSAGVSLGPISLTFGDDFETAKDTVTTEEPKSSSDENGTDEGFLKRAADAAGVSLGPISLTYGDDFSNATQSAVEDASSDDCQDIAPAESIHSMTTAEWREKYERDGYVDLWLEEEFNAGSRLMGGRDVHKGGVFGFQTGEGPSAGAMPRHKVTIKNNYANQVVEVEVPEDRYVLWEAEDHGLKLPYSCRMGCCTTCAVKVIEGEMYQPHSLGISKELKDQGYALMCVGYPRSDLVLETVPEDEVYDIQFGRLFAERALDKTASTVVRDDFALELADMDE